MKFIPNESISPLFETEIYVSVDIEADGPHPGHYSMLSLGAAAFNSSGKLLDTFSQNLLELPGASRHPDTMEWWEKQGDAWDKAREDARTPVRVIVEFKDWLMQPEWKGRAKSFVGYPVGYDYMWVSWYMSEFLGSDEPFNHSGIDIKTLGMLIMGKGFRQMSKRIVVKKIKAKMSKKHSHVAVEDAIEQGELFFQIIDYLRRN